MDPTKTVEVRMMQFSPHDSLSPLVFACYVSSRNFKGFPRAGRQTREGWVKSAVFLYVSVNISKTVADTAKVIIND